MRNSHDLRNSIYICHFALRTVFNHVPRWDLTPLKNFFFAFSIVLLLTGSKTFLNISEGGWSSLRPYSKPQIWLIRYFLDHYIYGEIIPIFLICPVHGFQSCVRIAPDSILMLLGWVTYHWVQNAGHSSSSHAPGEKKKSLGRSRKAWCYCFSAQTDGLRLTC